MRSLWIIITTLALANFLAVLGVVAWLGGTGRLSNERLHIVRELFKTTVEEDQVAAKTVEAEEARKAADAAREAFFGEPPTPAELAALIEEGQRARTTSSEPD